MAGHGAVRGRKLRRTENRDVAVRRTEASDKTRLASKRTLSDENCSDLVTIRAVLQPPSKRVALSNLTSNAVLSRSHADTSRASGKIETQGVAVQQKQLELNHGETVHGQTVAMQDPPSAIETEKMVVAQHHKAEINEEIFELKDASILVADIPGSIVLEEKEMVIGSRHVSGSELIPMDCNQMKTHSSLDSEMQDKCVALKDLNLKPLEDCLFQSSIEEGWSCNNYTYINDMKDPRMCSTYADDIYFHLRTAELRKRPEIDFMETVQEDINESMRSILVDWLVEVAEEYQLVADTLYLTVSFVDRFLSGNIVNRQRLQLLGVTCMLIASKYEEVCPPQVNEFCYITDNTYARDEVLEMERRILLQLNFELSVPTTKTFLRRIIQAIQAKQKTSIFQMELLGNYLAELTLIDYNFLRYLPSMIAGAAIFLAKLTLNPTSSPWNETLQNYSGYKASDLKDCVKAMHALQCNKKNCTLPAVREKYKQPKYKSVASLTPPVSIPLKYFDDVYDNQ